MTTMIMKLILSLLAIVATVSASQPDVNIEVDATMADSLSHEVDSVIVADSAATNAIEQNIVDTVVVIPRLDFSSIRLADALTAISRAHSLSVYVDSSVVGLISLRLDNVTLNDALLFIISQYDLAWERTGEIIKIFKPDAPPLPLEPLDVSFNDGLLSMTLKKVNLSRLVDTLIEISGRNIVVENGAAGTVTGKLSELPFNKALRVLLPANGFAVREVEGVLYVGVGASESHADVRSRSLNISCDNRLITMDIANSSLAQVIESLIRECGVSIFVQTALEGNINASFANKPIEEALTYLLLNTKFSFSEIAGIYFIGGRDQEDLFASRLLRLDHMIASSVESLIPVSLSKQVTITVVKEHNGLVVTGPSTTIARVEAFLNEIDVPAAQVLFDVLVVDYNLTEASEFGLFANNFGGDSGLPGQAYYPDVDISETGEGLRDNLASMARRLSISNPITLSDDFYVRLRMMQQEGKANIRSHPKIASLNGHTASIKVGTTQYYLMESKAVYSSSGTQPVEQTSQRFELVEAEMSLEVTPYVCAGNELIVEVKPEFSTPAQGFDPDIPPTINRRVLNSTVRLRDGETIVLGGLVQVSKTMNVQKVPILGSIPILGRLFQNRTSSDQKAELMIYVTPHVYYGSEEVVDLDSLLGGK